MVMSRIFIAFFKGKVAEDLPPPAFFSQICSVKDPKRLVLNLFFFSVVEGWLIVINNNFGGPLSDIRIAAWAYNTKSFGHYH